jgi:MoaA/NifB/PqqE/SkfB family radical SAM enzyme
MKEERVTRYKLGPLLTRFGTKARMKLAPGTWSSERVRRATELWKFHPRGDYYLARGGDRMPPPVMCNIGLTNKCNLRCEICGSQKYLDETGVRRRHMAFETFEAVAETIFPFLVTVELNSQGDPLLYPHIEDVLRRIAQHRCEVKLQTNGTLFTDRAIELLIQQHGTVMLSLDAVGPKFDEVRRGGVWAKAEPGLTHFLSARDPKRLSVGVYPTVTRRTIGEAINIVEWAAEHDVDTVVFHRYSPIQNSFEEAPSDDEYARMRELLRQWDILNGDSLEIRFEQELLSSSTSRLRRFLRRVEYADDAKREFLPEIVPFPREPGSGHPIYTCTSPIEYVEIGLEGQIAACCRAQDVTLGYATSVERFADAWLGPNYDRIRRSLRRDATGPYPLPNCEGCVKFFAPKAAGNRVAVSYERGAPLSPHALDLDAGDEIPIEAIQKEQGHCHITLLPPGIDPMAFELWEDDRRLGPGETLHDEIRAKGGGRYSIWGRSLYFSTSDNTDARRNERMYVLRRRAASRWDSRRRWLSANNATR